jgi:hypothetical protein
VNDVFLSYASGDRAVAHELADALEALGWSVWWDREIPYGKPFDQVIEEELNAARCVIVLWTAESVTSRWVKTEAAAAADRDRLIPVLLERVPIPFEFRRIQTAELYDWSGDRGDPELVRLVDSVKSMLGEPGAPQASPSQPRSGGRRSSSLRWKTTAAGAAILVLLAAVGLWVTREADSPRPSASDPAQVQALPAVVEEAGPREAAQATAAAPAAQEASATTRAAQSAASPAAQSAASPAAQSAASPAASTSPTGPFAIKIGDRIDDGVPQAGAGFIDAPGEKDVYTFSATARQRVYFRMLKHARGMEQIGWTLTDPSGRAVFETRLGYTEPGVQLLRAAGTYRLTVGSDQVPATGGYAMQLFDVPAPQQFPVRIGDVISENAPVAGAGRIASPGARNVYVFEASAGQRVYFRKFEHGAGMELIEWKLFDADGAEVLNTRLGYGEPGTQVLRRGGAYRLEIGSDQVPATGVYRMQLIDVAPPQRFTVKIGDAIGENAPASGAGVIERPGAKDVYVFTAEPGQRVYFRKLEHARGMEQIEWRLVDSDGTQVFNSRLGYGDPGAQVLRRGGTYTMEVGSDNNPATGSYRMQLTAPAG